MKQEKKLLKGKKKKNTQKHPNRKTYTKTQLTEKNRF